MRRHLPLISGAAVLVVIAVVVVAFMGGGSSRLCDDLLEAQAHGSDDFVLLRGAPVDNGGWDADPAFEGADSCTVIVDPERAALTCRWEYPGASTDAWDSYHSLVEDVRECQVEGVSEFQDRPVNHPDFYEATVLEPDPSLDLIVAIKYKGHLGKILVSLGVAFDRTT